jgi:phosphotransferase system HPr (HPr) family protein
MYTEKIVIANKYGLQSKMAAIFIHKASGFSSAVWIEKDERKANAKSLLGLLSLGVAKGDEITLITDGEDAEECAQALKEYLLSDLGED